MPSTTAAAGEKSFERGTRVVPPAETIARVTPFLAEMGITRVANVTGLDTVGIPTVMVTRPNGRSLSVSQGKGATLEAAKASGIMEAIEQHCAERPGIAVRFASLDDLRDAGAAVVDVRGLPRSIAPYRPDARILWAEGTALGGGGPVLVPFELVHLDFTLPLPPGTGHFLGGSNGLASGNRADEAVAHALCELVERDATTLYYSLPEAAARARRLDLGSVDDPLCRDLVERFRAAAVFVAAWDITSDVALPAYLVAAIDEAPGPFRPVGLARGAGCHLDPAVALSRALCEAAQSRLTRVAGTRDDIQRGDVDRLKSEAVMAATLDELRATAAGGRRFADAPRHPSGDLADDVERIRARLAVCGCPDVVVVDLSRPHLPLAVVRVIVPGLEALLDLPGWHPGPRSLRAPELMRL